VSVLRWAIGLLAVEAAGVAAVAGFLIYEDATSAPTAFRGGGLAMTVLAAGFAALFAVLVRALLRRRSWARGPAIFLQLMLLPIGYYMVRGGLGWLGVPVLVLGLCGAGLLVTPAAREALGVR